MDGFDGRVIAGSTTLLQKDHPAVLFEFHPELMRQTGNDPLQPFQVLSSNGYRQLIWFDKFGSFYHHGSCEDHKHILEVVELCFQRKPEDPHFDIIALPVESDIDPEELAACGFAKQKKYRH